MLSQSACSQKQLLLSIFREAFYEVVQHQENLGIIGIEVIKKNRFGDTSLRADVEAEEVLLACLKRYKVPVRVISEEHGVVDVVPHPRYLAVLDGIDGTSAYKEKGRYGSLFAVYEEIDPYYNDYVFGAVVDHTTGNMFFASKDKGTWMENKKQHNISTMKTTKYASNRLYADLLFDKVFGVSTIADYTAKIKGYEVASLKSSAIHYVDLFLGKVDAVIECTRKNNLEIATAFPLVVEAGGAMVNEFGSSLGKQKYYNFGQAENEHLIVISAAQLDTALDIVRQFKT